jgi:hypothetical protein
MDTFVLSAKFGFNLTEFFASLPWAGILDQTAPINFGIFSCTP